MQYKFFTFPITQYSTQEENLNKFLRSHKVVEIEKHLVSSVNGSSWCFCIGYVATAVNFTSSKSPKINYEAVLSKEHFARFEELRKVRKEVADSLNIPAYAVFTNKELSELAQVESEITQEVLLKIEGFGEGRLQKSGNAFLEKMNNTND